MNTSLLRKLTLAFALAAASAFGQAPGIISHQGKITVGGNSFTGTGQFKFALLHTNGGAITDWSNDGTSTTGSEPTAAVSLAVSRGIFSVNLGDTTLANMTTIPASVFANSAAYLRVWFNDGTNGSVRISPDRRVTSVGYALYANTAASADTVAAANITGTISPSNIASGTISAAMLATGSVTTASLAEGAVTLGKLNTAFAGTLSTTFTNPTPAASDLFGYAVAAVGADKVLIGAYLDDTGATDAGAAYLFSASGKLLTTFTNPTPAAYDYFGYAVAAIGADKVLIGAPFDDASAGAAGAVYLFSTNGALLATFTNPTPFSNDDFGYAIAAVGADKVLIGAPFDNTGATDAGAAYLFSTNGALLTTFTNPTPAASDTFGYSVAGVGADKVLIAAPSDDTGALNTGAAYLFTTNGALLTTFTNPTPGSRRQLRQFRGRGGDGQGARRHSLGRHGCRGGRGGVSVQHQRHAADHLRQSQPGSQ